MADPRLSSELCSAGNNSCLQMSADLGVFRVCKMSNLILRRCRGDFAKFKYRCRLDQRSYLRIEKKIVLLLLLSAENWDKNEKSDHVD